LGKPPELKISEINAIRRLLDFEHRIEPDEPPLGRIVRFQIRHSLELCNERLKGVSLWQGEH